MNVAGDESVLLDASVLVELVTRGRHAASAEHLLSHVERHPDVDLITAAHGLVEAVSALRRLNLTGVLDDDGAAESVRWLRGLDLRLDPTGPRIERAWTFRHSMTAYDAVYAAAADGLGLPLVSVDGPLLAASASAGVAAVHLDDLEW